MNYESIEEGMAVKANDILYLVVATDLEIKNPSAQSITLYDTKYRRLVYPSLFEWGHRNRLWTNTAEIQEVFSKESVQVSIL